MPATRALLDTNVLVYAYDADSEDKQERAREALSLLGDGRAILSAQVLGEFYVVVTRKLARPLDADVAAEVVGRLSTFVVVATNASLVRSAVAIGRRWQLSYWDALIIAAAQAAGCERVLTEDLSAGQRIGSVTIENPFA